MKFLNEKHFKTLNKAFLLSSFVFVASVALSLLGSSLAVGSDFEPITPEAPGAMGRRTPVVMAIEKARPAVVSIYTKGQQTQRRSFRRDPFFDDFFNRFYGNSRRPQMRQGITLGSGVIIDGPQGLVVTNEHVVRGAASITVTLSTGKELEAEVLGADPRFDLAVLKIKGDPKLPTLELGNSDDLMIGETVIAIGNPFGFSHTATTGVVSATDRSLPDSRNSQGLQGLIQTDASINPGNSGGPLLNIKGEVVGINTAIVAKGEGLGFAIPSSQVKRITARLAKGDQDASSLNLGLHLAESGQRQAQQSRSGCLVIGVDKDSPAAKAGFQKGDMLMTLDGSPTARVSDYEIILSSLEAGKPVKAEILRGNNTLTLTPAPHATTTSEALSLAWDLYGLKVQVVRGKLILDQPKAGSPAERLGIKQGDILISLGLTQTDSVKSLGQAILKNRFQNNIGINIRRGRTVFKATLSR